MKWWRVGRSVIAHARCFNGLMSIYGLSSELTARRAVYMFCTNVARLPPMSDNPRVQGVDYTATRARGTDVGITLYASVQGRTIYGFYTTVDRASRITAAARLYSARNVSSASENRMRAIP